GEPRRHHQIVGSQFEIHLLRGLDELEILVGQFQDRDLGDVDLLVARQRQEKIERALETIDLDEERFVRSGQSRRLEIEIVARVAHALTLNSSVRRASAAAGSNGSGSTRCESACSARLSACPSSGLTSDATSFISSNG